MFRTITHISVKVVKHKFLFYLIIFLAQGGVFAQSTTNVSITGIPGILPSPYFSDFEQNVYNGVYQVQANVVGNSTVNIRFHVTVSKDGQELIDETSLPIELNPGMNLLTPFPRFVKFSKTTNQVMRDLPSDIVQQVIQGGTFPEGDYSITMQAYEVGSNIPAGSVGIANFMVRYPQPSALLFPANASEVGVNFPVFSWTPVLAPRGTTIEYDFLLVEVFDRQNPGDALLSNREHASIEVIGNTALPYTGEFLPLEQGKTYAWQVTARDANDQIPIKNDGKSEIYTFTYLESQEEPISELEELDEIILIPDFATLVDLDQSEIVETETSYVINGSATLQLDFSFIDDASLNASLQNVEVQKRNLDNPVLLAGSLQAEPDGLEHLLFAVSGYAEFRNITWNFGSGMSAELSVKSPEGTFLEAHGDIALQHDGLHGEVTATGSPISSFQHQLFGIDILEVSAKFPEGQIWTSSQASLFGDPVCGTSDMSVLRDRFRVGLNCDIEQTLPMVDHSQNLVLSLHDLYGQITGSWDGRSISYEVNTSADIDLLLTEDRQCGASATLTVSSEDGIDAGEFSPTCNVPRPAVDLGFLHATKKNVSIHEIDVNEEADGFDYEIAFDTQLYFPSTPDLSLPELEGITISKDGIAFRAHEYTRRELPVNNEFTIGNFELFLERFELDNFVFPWFDWNGEGAGPWEFAFDAGLRLPLSDHLPDCFSDTILMIENASVSDDYGGEMAVRGTAGSTEAASCSWNIGPGFDLQINSFTGDVLMEKTQEDFSLQTDFMVDADLFTEAPFNCSGDSVIELDEFTMSLEEGVNAELSDFVPDCPVNIGPFTAHITDGTLIFEYSEEAAQRVIVDADAVLELSGRQNATGSFVLDLTTGEFLDVHFEIDGLFEWGIPRDEPILVFTIDEASVSKEGLFIDGRHSVQTESQQIGTTFDDVLFDWQNYEILEGRIIFDQGFGFTAGVDSETNSLEFMSAIQEAGLNLHPGVLMELAGAVQIDTLGIRSSGSASASVNLKDMEMDGLEVEYSDDFAIHIDPLQITYGRADFYWNDSRIAYANNSGFYPDQSFFDEDLLPDRIPLPGENVAYLQIRDEITGELLVNAEQLENGTYRIETQDGQPPEMVVPVLQTVEETTPPSIAVELDDFVIDPANGSYVSGMAFAEVDDNHPMSNRPNLPVQINEIFFAAGANNAGRQITALFLSGNIKLFDTIVEGDGQNINLHFDSSGLLKGGFVLPGANTEIPLDGPGGRVVLAADSLSGSYEWDPRLPVSSTFNINIDGGFQLNDYDGSKIVRADLALEYNEHGVHISDFNPGELLDYTPIDFGFFSFHIPAVNSLNLSYDERTGFDYYAALDLVFDLNINEQSVPVPLGNVEIRHGTGFHFPKQEIDLAEVPGFNIPGINFGEFQIEPIAFRLSESTFNWNGWSPGDLPGLIPHLDFALSFPQFKQSAPNIANLSLTLQDASFRQGILIGEILPLDVSMLDAFLPIGSGAGINLDSVGGELFEQETEQRFSIHFDGTFEMPEFFTDSNNSCPPPEVRAELVHTTKIEGVISGIEPCGRLDLGPVGVAFGQSDLEFFVDNDQQLATLEGSAEAFIQTEDDRELEAGGELLFDLISGRILDGSLSISREFPWYYPASNPFFEFRVESAELNENGLVFDAGGELELGEGSAGVNFQQMTFDIPSAVLIDGRAQILNEIAFDISLSPSGWLIANPDQAPEFDQGLRLTLPANVSIDANGMAAAGQSEASLYFGDEKHDQLLLDFVNTRFGFGPEPAVTEGRADLILEEDGEQPNRLGWYDSEGFHPDNLLAAVPLPEILPLPHEDIAYIALTDDLGNNLVESENVSEGLSISTINSIPIVITAFEDSQGDPLTVDVTFDDIVINAALEMVGGTILADLEDSPLRLDEQSGLPFSITKLEYRREDGKNYLYSDATLMLPGELEELKVAAEDIALGPDGFEEAVISLGEYSVAYDSDNEEVVAEHVFADGAFAVTLRGAELNFGADPGYRISGDITSNLFRNDNEHAIVHLGGEYGDSEWMFFAESSHLAQLLPVGTAEIVLDDLAAETEDEHFALLIEGRFKLPDIIGDNMEIGINLSVGTDGIDAGQDDSFAGITLSLFGQQDNLKIDDLDLEITDDYHLVISLDGDLSFLGEEIAVSDFEIGSDGTFRVDGGANLLDDTVELLGDNLVLTTLEIGSADGKARLSARADLLLPEPVRTDSEVGIHITHQGDVTVEQPDINFTEVSEDIPAIGTASLEGVIFDVNSISEVDFGIYAMANLEFENSDNGTIKFGEATGNTGDWGLRHQSGESLEWRITEIPEFEFENEMFNFAVTPGAGDVGEAMEEFGVVLNVNAGLAIGGVGGSIAFNGMVISTSGLDDLGEFQNADLHIGGDDEDGIISLALDSFEYERDGGELDIEAAGGNVDDPDVQKNPEVVTESISTLRHIVFSGEITMPGSISGNVDEVLYYETTEMTHLAIKNAELELSNRAELTASLEYENYGGGNFALYVAGGAIYSPPGGSDYELRALGKMENLEDHFSFGIFVKLDAEVPIVPGILTLNSFGGGFFYNADESDFDNVLALADYDLTHDNAPWEEEVMGQPGGGVDFAIIVYSGAGIIGSEGNYIVDANAFLFITSDWLAIDLEATVFEGTPAEIQGGMYLNMRWSPIVMFDGGFNAELTGSAERVASGNFELHFQVARETVGEGSETAWAVNGGVDVEVLRILNFSGEFIAGNNGFYFNLGVPYEFDVKLVSASAMLDLEFWWVFDQQLGAHIEFSVEIRMFSGLFKGGGDFTGALIINGGYLVYATATVWVDVRVYTGYATGYVSVRNGNYSAGRGGSDQYEHLIDEAREDAKNMNESLTEALEAAEDLGDVVVLNKIDDEDLAEAGAAIISDWSARYVVFSSQLAHEESLTGTVPDVFYDINEAMKDAGTIPTTENNRITARESAMNHALDELAGVTETVYDDLSEIEANAIAWEAESAEMLESVLDTPVESKQLSWGAGGGDMPGSAPHFSIDENIAQQNIETLETYRAGVEQMQTQFQEAILDIWGNIQKLESALSEGGTNINAIAETYSEAVSASERYYASLGAAYWHGWHWAMQGLSRYEGVSSYMESAVAGAAEDMLDEAGINMHYNASEPEQSLYSFKGIVVDHYFPGAPMGNRSVNDIHSNIAYEDLDFEDLAPVPYLEDQYKEAVHEYLDSAYGDDIVTLLTIAAERKGYIMHFTDDGDYQSARTTDYNYFWSLAEDRDYKNFFMNWVNRAIEFWYGMPKLGYENLQESAIVRAEGYYDEAFDNPSAPMPALMDSYAEFTNAVDNIYSVKHSIHVNLEEALRLYIDWLEDLDGGGSVSFLEEILDYVQSNSLPPKIASVHSGTHFDRYMNEFTVSWNATHPTGNVIENSYYLQADGYSSHIYTDDFVSVGNKNSITRYLFQRNQSEGNRDVQVRIRARGPSGLTIRRLFTGSPEVLPPPSSDDSYYEDSYPSEYTPYTGLESSDPGPPDPPAIEFPSYTQQEYEIPFNSQWGASTLSATRNWSTDSSMLEFTARSFDEVYDVSQFEFRIGTNQGEGAIMDWTQQSGDPIEGSAPDYQRLNVHGLNLEPGTDYYVTVRAINGAGVKSESATKGPVRIDEKPPSMPGERSNSVGQVPTGTYGDSDIFHEAVRDDYRPMLNAPYYDKEEPLIRVSWDESEDEHSGIKHYKVVPSTYSDVQFAMLEDEIHIYTHGSGSIFSYPSTHLTDENFNFEDEFYFHILAEDHAGNLSAPLTLGPVVISDPTSPTTPEIVARANKSEIGFYLKRPASDFESGVDHYYYEIVHSEGNGEPITTGELTSIDDSFGHSPPFITLSGDNVPEGVPLTIRVAAVNTQGTISRFGESGDIYFDTTPPEIPEVVVELNEGDIDINVSNIHDPESGITSVEYRVRDNQGNVLQDWKRMRDLQNFSRASDGERSATYTTGDLEAASHRVDVRVTNGNGMETAVYGVHPWSHLNPDLQHIQNENINVGGNVNVGGL